MRPPISVRLHDGVTDRHITDRVRRIGFSKSAPGGHDTCQLTFISPPNEWGDLGPSDRVVLYDTQTGRVLWEGYTNKPNPTSGPNGGVYDLTALGGRSLLADRTEKLMWIDRGIEHWRPETLLTQHPNGTRELPGTLDTGVSGIVLALANGNTIALGDRVGVRYYGFDDSPMRPGLYIDTVASAPGLLMKTQVYGDAPGGVPSVVAANHTGGTYAAMLTPGAPTAGRWSTTTTRLGVSLYADYTPGPGFNPLNDDQRVLIAPPVVVAQLHTAAGALVDMGTHGTALWAHHIITDMIGRLLPWVDPTRSSIDTTADHDLTQVTYPDGATPAQVLEDLHLYEPDFFHEVLESDPTSGKHVLNWRKWADGNPRYVISTKDGYEAPGGESAMTNRMAVYWTDPNGVQRRTYVTETIPALDTPAFGPPRIRDAQPITLPDGLGSETLAQAIGSELLAQANRGTNAGRAVVRNRIRDLWTGHDVWPWQIEPGYPVYVSETQEEHRLTAVAYDNTASQAVLTLGEPERSQAQLVADAWLRNRTNR